MTLRIKTRPNGFATIRIFLMVLSVTFANCYALVRFSSPHDLVELTDGVMHRGAGKELRSGRWRGVVHSREITRDVDTNSWAIAHLDELITAQEQLVEANSYKLVSMTPDIFPSYVTRFGPIWSSILLNTTVQSLAWSPRGSQLAVGGAIYDGATTRVWQFYGSSLVELLGCKKNHGSLVNTVVWRPTGKRFLATGGFAGTGGVQVRIYAFDGVNLTESPGCQLILASEVYEIAWSHNGHYLAVIGRDLGLSSQVRVYIFDDETETLTELTDCRKNHGATLNSVSWSADDQYLAVGGDLSADNYSLRVYEFDATTSSMTVIPDAQRYAAGGVSAVRWHPATSYLFAATAVGDLRTFSFDGHVLTPLPQGIVVFGVTIHDFVVSQGGLDLFCVTDSTAASNLRALSFYNEQLIDLADTHVVQGGSALYSVAVNEVWGALAAGGHAETALDVRTINKQSLIVANSQAIVTLAASSTSLLIGNSTRLLDDTVMIGRINTLLSPLAECSKIHGADVLDVKWHPGGKYLALGGAPSGGYIVRVYAFVENKQLTELVGCRITGIASARQVAWWSPDGYYLAVCGQNIVGGAEILVYRFDQDAGTLTVCPGCSISLGGWAGEVSWHPSGSFLAIGGHDISATKADLRIFSFNATPGAESLTNIAACDKAIGDVYAIDWSCTGIYLAVGIKAAPGLYMYQFVNQNSLVQLATATFGTQINVIRWHPHRHTLFAGNLEGNVQGYEFNGSSLITLTGTAVTIGAAVNNIVIDHSGLFIFVASNYINSYNLRAYAFDGVWLLENSAMRKAQGTGILYSVSLCPSGRFLAAGGAFATSVDVEVYPLGRNSLISDNSWALLSASDWIAANSGGVIANSFAIATLDWYEKAGSDAIYTSSWAISHIGRLINNDSNALICNSIALRTNGMLDLRLKEDSNAVVVASNAIYAQSWAVSSTDFRRRANSAAIMAHSNSLIRFDEMILSDSAALVACSAAITGYVSNRVAVTSWAILSQLDYIVPVEMHIDANSWGVLAGQNRFNLAVADVAANSSVLVSCASIMSNAEVATRACSHGLIAHSWSILYLDDRIVPNSSAIVAHSWSIAHLWERVIEDSNAVAEIGIFVTNSWAIVALEDRLRAVEIALTAASDALIAHSWSIVGNNALSIATSWSLVSIELPIGQVSQLIADNSSALVTIDAGVDGCSRAIAHFDQRMTAAELTIVANSNALYAHSWSIVSLEPRVLANIMGATYVDAKATVANFTTRIKDNSWAILARNDVTAYLSAVMTANSNALIAHSASIVNLPWRATADSSAIVAWSNAMPALANRITTNSFAIRSLNDKRLSLEPALAATSWSVLSYLDHGIGFVTQNSWAVANAQNRVAALEAAVAASSHAVVAHSASINYLDQLTIATSNLLIGHSEALFYGEPIRLGASITGCAFNHGAAINGMSWSKDGQYLAIGGVRITNTTTRVYRYNPVAETLTQVAVANHAGAVQEVAWHPSGNYLAIVGARVTGFGGRVYSFDGSSLTELTGCRMTVANTLYSVKWHPSGNYLAVGGNAVTAGNQVGVYAFNSTPGAESLTLLPGTVKAHGKILYSLGWSPSGQYLAAGGVASGGITIRVYEFVNDNVLFDMQLCRLSVDTTINTLEWHPSGDFLFSGSAQSTIRMMRFEFGTLTQLATSPVATPSVVNHLAINDDGRFLFAGLALSTYNLRGYYFNFRTGALVEEVWCRVTQGTGAVLAIEEHPNNRRLTAGTGTAGVTNCQTYPVIYGFLPSNNSWSVQSLSDRLPAMSNAIVAQSWSIANLDDRMKTTNNAVLANSAAINYLDTLVRANSSAIVAHSANVASTAPIATLLVANSSAIILLTSRLANNSWSTLNLNERAQTSSNAIVANSGAIASLAERNTAASNALIATSAAIAYRVDQVMNNSNAILALNNRFDLVNAGIRANSFAVLHVWDRLAVLDTLFAANSSAILSLHQRLNVQQSSLVAATSSALVANSASIINLGGRIAENSNAVYANSFALSNLSARVAANSNAIVTISWLTADSWLIIGAEARVADAEDAVAVTSHALIANSGSIVVLNTQETTNSNAIVSFFPWATDTEPLVYANSSAIIMLSSKMRGDSGGVAHIDQRTTALEYNVAAASNALVAHSAAIVHIDLTESANSYALLHTDELFEASSFEADMQANSSALAHFSEHITTTVDALLVANSNALVGHSSPLVFMAELDRANSSAAMAHSASLWTLSFKIKSNSSAIVALNPRLAQDEAEIKAQSDTLISLNARLDLSGQNSWAVAALNDRIVVAESVIAADSSSHYATSWVFPSLSQQLLDNSVAVVAESWQVFTGAISHVGSSIGTLTHGANVNSIDWYGNYLAVGGALSGTTAVRVWRGDGASFVALPGCDFAHGAVVNAVAWHPSGNYLAVGGVAGTGGYRLRVLSFDGIQLTECAGCNFTLADSLTSLSWRPDGRFLAATALRLSGNNDIGVYSFNAVPGSESLSLLTGTLYNHAADVNKAVWSPSGTYIAMGAAAAGGITVRLFEFKNENSLYALPGGALAVGASVNALTWYVSDEFLFVGASNGTLKAFSFDYVTLTDMPACTKALTTAINGLAMVSVGQLLVVGQTITAGANIRIFSFSYPDRTLTVLPSGTIAQGTNNILSVASSDDEIHFSAAGVTAVAIDTYPVFHESLVLNNSWALAAAAGNETAAQNQFINNNSAAIVNLRNYLDLVNYNSNAIVVLADRTDAMTTLNVATSNAVRADSAAVYGISLRIKPDSSALIANSAAIINLSIRTKADSSAIVAHSNSIMYLNDFINANSFAIVYQNDLIKAVSSAIVSMRTLAIATSNALVKQDAEITEKLASTDTQALSSYLGSFDHGPAHLHFLSSVVTLTYDLFLSSNHQLNIRNTLTIAGAGHMITLPLAQQALIAKASTTLTFENTYIKNYAESVVSRESGSSITFGNNSVLVLSRSQDLALTWTFAGSTALFGNNKTLTLLPGGRLYVAPSSSLTIHDLAVTNLVPLSIICEPTSSIIFDNVSLTIPTSYPFATGSFLVKDLAINNGIFSYESELPSTIATHGTLLLSNLTFSCQGQPLLFTDSSSRLELSTVAIASTTPGLTLKKGRLVLSGRNYINAPAATITFGDNTSANNLYITINPGGSLELQSGALDYLNVE